MNESDVATFRAGPAIDLEIHARIFESGSGRDVPQYSADDVWAAAVEQKMARDGWKLVPPEAKAAGRWKARFDRAGSKSSFGGIIFGESPEVATRALAICLAALDAMDRKAGRTPRRNSRRNPMSLLTHAVVLSILSTIEPTFPALGF